MTIKERTIDAVKQLIAIQKQEKAIKTKRIELEQAITAIAVEDYREYSDPDSKDNLEFHSLIESPAVHF